MAKVEIINGISYKDEEEAKKAKKEWEGIQFILSKNDMDNLQTVLAVYNKLSQRELFQTEVGKKFLRELKERLLEAEEIDNKKIVGFCEEDEKWLRERKKKKAKQERENERKANRKKEEQRERESIYQHKYHCSVIINILLVVAIFIMAYITLNSKQVNILNYENALIDKYESWENSLEQREAELAEREKALEK